MSSFPEVPDAKTLALALLLTLPGIVLAQSPSKYPGIGRDATPKEVAAWDIDVRPDFMGLPAGSGSVAMGQDVWETKCASCHGIFGESGEVFNPIVGGTTAKDIETGRVARLNDAAYPGRTTLMKVSTLSSLWDYISRAMPWTQPKSLSTEEVYAVTAFILNLGGIVPDGFVLSDKNIRDVQQRMPNRNGMSTNHALWPGKEFGNPARPDTRNVACMSNCITEAKVSSFLPDFARNAHGNLAEQNRKVGPQHGVDTTLPEGRSSSPSQVALNGALSQPKLASEGTGISDSKVVQALLQKYSCNACHGMDKKLVGPSFHDIAKKHAGQVDYLAGKIKSGGQGVWGPVPMPAQALTVPEAKTLASWISSGAGK